MKQSIKNSEELIRCFNVVNNSKNAKFGLTCNHVLLAKNSVGKVAGRIKCKWCKAVYEIIDNEIFLIERK